LSILPGLIKVRLPYQGQNTNSFQNQLLSLWTLISGAVITSGN